MTLNYFKKIKSVADSNGLNAPGKKVCLNLTILPEAPIEFFYNLTFPGKSWQDPASIDIQWVATFVCQCCRDPAMICQEITNYRKTRMFSCFVVAWLWP